MLPDAANGYIDSINGVTGLANGTVHVPGGQSLTVVGWAVDGLAKQPAKNVFIDLDGRLYLAQYGAPRQDVADALKEPAFLNSGYTVTIPVPPSDVEHRVTLKVVNAAGTGYYSGMSASFIVQ
jgi:hypothetical protein